MAYTINKTDGTVVATVEDGVLDTTTTLQLIGRNYQSYGEPFNENLVKLLENSASTSAPSSPLTGELWYDKSANTLKVYNGSNFVNVAVVNSSTQPTVGLSEGTLWNDTTNDQLFMYDGSGFDLIGPIFKTGDGISGFRVDVTNLAGGGTTNLLGLYLDGTRVGILSTALRELDTAPDGFGTTTIQQGLTLYSPSDSTSFRLQGTAQNALELGGKAATSYMSNDENETMTGTLTISNNSGLIIGASSDGTIDVSNSDLVITNNNANQNIIFKINQASVVTTAMTVTDTADVVIAGNLTVGGNLTTAGSSSSFADSVIAINDENGNSGTRDSNQNAGLLIDGAEASNDVTFQVNGADGGPLRSSSGLSVASGKAYDIAGTDVLSGTTLGSTIVTSSLTTVGALNSGSITIGFGDIDVGDSNFVAAGTVRTGALILPFQHSEDSSTRAQIDNVSNDGNQASTNPEKTILTEQAIRAYVTNQLLGTDLVFELDITGLSNAEIAAVLDVAAPHPAFPNGKKARIIGLTLSASSTSSFSSGSIGNPASVSTTTTLNRSRNSDLLFTLTAGNWAYTSG